MNRLSLFAFAAKSFKGGVSGLNSHGVRVCSELANTSRPRTSWTQSSALRPPSNQATSVLSLFQPKVSGPEYALLQKRTQRMSLPTLPFAGNLAHDYVFIRSQDRVSGSSVNFRVQLPEQYEGVTGIELMSKRISPTAFTISRPTITRWATMWEPDPRQAASRPALTTQRLWPALIRLAVGRIRCS